MPTPIAFSDVRSTVVQPAIGDEFVGGWHVDSRHDGISDAVTVQPVVSTDSCYMRVRYHDTARDVVVEGDLNSKSRLPLPDSLSSVTCSAHRRVNGRDHSVEMRIGGKRPTFMYSYADGFFRASATSAYTDGLATVATASTKLHEAIFAGLSIDYDPSRSGIRNLIFGASQTNIPRLRNGDVYAQYDFCKGLGLHLSIPVKASLCAAAIVERGRMIFGVYGQPAPNLLLRAYLNACDYTATVTAECGMGENGKVRMRSPWKVSLSARFPLCSGSGIAPSAGILFSHENGLKKHH